MKSKIEIQTRSKSQQQQQNNNKNNNEKIEQCYIKRNKTNNLAILLLSNIKEARC